VGKETRFFTKLFKNTGVKIAFTANNNIERLLSTHCNLIQNKYDKYGIYQLTCPSCNKKYIGQTGGQFRIGFQEHFRDNKCMKNKSKFAQHLLQNEHPIGPMENTMDIIYTTGKAKC
jgi:hypothetical protein